MHRYSPCHLESQRSFGLAVQRNAAGVLSSERPGGCLVRQGSTENYASIFPSLRLGQTSIRQEIEIAPLEVSPFAYLGLLQSSVGNINAHVVTSLGVLVYLTLQTAHGQWYQTYLSGCRSILLQSGLSSSPVVVFRLIYCSAHSTQLNTLTNPYIVPVYSTTIL